MQNRSVDDTKREINEKFGIPEIKNNCDDRRRRKNQSFGIQRKNADIGGKKKGGKPCAFECLPGLSGGVNCP